MLEDDCLILDIKMSGQNAVKDNKLTTEEYEDHIDAYNKITDIEHAISDCEEKIELIIEAATLNICQNPEREEQIQSIYQTN